MNELELNRTTAFLLDGLGTFTEVLGMVAENQWRLSVGKSIAYGEDAFNEKAQFIFACASLLRG